MHLLEKKLITNSTKLQIINHLTSLALADFFSKFDRIVYFIHTFHFLFLSLFVAINYFLVIHVYSFGLLFLLSLHLFI